MGEQTPELPPEQDQWAGDLIGAVLDDRYRVDRLLGSGGMGAVYLGEQTILRKSVAIKVLRPEYAHREVYVRRFLREARAASKIAHRHVVEVTDFGQAEGGRVYFVMEHLQGQDLAALVRAEGKLPWRRVRGILLQMVRALKAAHAKGIIHRDIKPANVFLVRDEDEDADFVKVLDFGIAKVVEADDSSIDGLTNSNQMMGTAMYMAPEQALGRGVDARSDIYALGAVAFQLLTGRMPFLGANAFEVLMKRVNEPPPTLRGLAPDLAPVIEELVRRAMGKEPAARFQTMAEIEAAILGIPADVEASEAERHAVLARPTSPQSAHAVAAQSVESEADTPLRVEDLGDETRTSSRQVRSGAAVQTEAAGVPLPVAAQGSAAVQTQQAPAPAVVPQSAPARVRIWPWILGLALVAGFAGVVLWPAAPTETTPAAASDPPKPEASTPTAPVEPAPATDPPAVPAQLASPGDATTEDAATGGDALATTGGDAPAATPAATPQIPDSPGTDKTKQKKKASKPATVGGQIKRLTSVAKRRCGGSPGGKVTLKFLVDGGKAGLLEVSDSDQPKAVTQCVRNKFSGATFVEGTHGLRTAVVRF